LLLIGAAQPENLVFGNKTLTPVKICDFGLSKVLDGSGMTDTPCGTVGYLAPEIAKEQAHNFGVDVWGLGCVLYSLYVTCRARQPAPRRATRRASSPCRAAWPSCRARWARQAVRLPRLLRSVRERAHRKGEARHLRLPVAVVGRRLRVRYGELVPPRRGCLASG